MPQGQLVIKLSKCKLEELARKWEMSFVHEVLPADPCKAEVISLRYPEDLLFKLTKVASKPLA